jgi:Flp pilus assembly protein TadD
MKKMKMRQKHNSVTFLLSISVTGLFLLSTTGMAKQRGLSLGDKMPEFSAVDPSGHSFNYQHTEGKVLMVMFLSAGQKNSVGAASDINTVMAELGKDAERMDIVVVVEDPDNNYLQSEEKKLVKDFHAVIDTKFQLWGKFGIIATPTVIISDANDEVTWVKAGYGYDFIPDVRAHINQALGLAQATAKETVQVRTVANNTVSAKVKRHLQMAQILFKKGEYESAKSEILTAQKLDPNSIEVKLDLAEFLCRTNQGQAALREIDKIKTGNNQERARIQLLNGWANRQMGNLDIAEKYLTEAKTLDPKSLRTLFELGRVYQARGQTEKAMKLYYEALAIVLGEPKDKKISP